MNQILTPENSAALLSQGWSYPAEWQGRVPRRVLMIKTARPYHVWVGKVKQPVALAGTIFDVWVSWTGLTIVLLESGEGLCVALDTFVVIAWHERTPLCH